MDDEPQPDALAAVRWPVTTGRLVLRRATPEGLEPTRRVRTAPGVSDWLTFDAADAEQARGVQAELGWVLDPAYAGRGLATEAVTELLRICVEELGLRRLTASCFTDNTASWRLMERVGMRLELHTVAESLHRSGRWLDGYGYALLAEKWRAGR